MAPSEFTPLVGEVTWCSGDTVAVFLWCLEPAGLIMFNGGGFEPKGPENKSKAKVKHTKMMKSRQHGLNVMNKSKHRSYSLS